MPKIFSYDSLSDCERLRDAGSGSGVRTYQLVVTFESNLGDLDALEVDVSSLTDSTFGNPILSQVRGYHRINGPTSRQGVAVVCT